MANRYKKMIDINFRIKPQFKLTRRIAAKHSAGDRFDAEVDRLSAAVHCALAYAEYSLWMPMAPPTMWSAVLFQWNGCLWQRIDARPEGWDNMELLFRGNGKEGSMRFFIVRDSDGELYCSFSY